MSQVHILEVMQPHSQGSLLPMSMGRRENLGTRLGEIPVGGREGAFCQQKSSISLPCLSQGVPYFMTMILKKDHITKVMRYNLEKTLSFKYIRY